MAARWAHMQQGSLKPNDMGQQSPDPKYEDVEEVLGSDPNHDEHGAFPDEFGIGGGITSSRNRRGSLTASSAAGSALVGAGPNGTRTFLKGIYTLMAIIFVFCSAFNLHLISAFRLVRFG